MNINQILQIVASLPMMIATVESIRGRTNGKAKKEDVRAAVLASTATMEAFNKLSVRDRKAFNKGLDKVIDGIVSMLNASEWK